MSGSEFRKDRETVYDPVLPTVLRRERSALERVDLALNAVMDQDPDSPVRIRGDGDGRSLQLRRLVHWRAAFGGNGPDVVDGQNRVRGAEEPEFLPTACPRDTTDHVWHSCHAARTPRRAHVDGGAHMVKASFGGNREHSDGRAIR